MEHSGGHTFISRFQERYGDESVAVPNACSNVIEQLLAHRSVRSYRSDEVTDDQVAVMIAAAQSAATSSNLQAWSVVAVRSSERRARLAILSGEQKHVRDAPLQLVWLADLNRLASVAADLGRSAAGLDYLEMFLVGAIDAALAAQNAVIAAESLGLSTVYIGGMRNHVEEVAKLLNLPPKVVALFGLCVGYEDPMEAAQVKPRLSQQAVLHHECYDAAIYANEVERYNTTMAAFYQKQNMNVHGTWAVHSAKRIAGPESLSGRDHLKSGLCQRGFGLK